MPRPTRVHVDGALCLVTCRALEGATLFQEPRDYETYLELLREYQDRYGFKLFAYALLPDHLALCLEPASGTTVSTFMHALNSRYTKYVIKRHGRTGHLFQERFRLILVEKAPWLLRVTGYLHTLPRRSGVTEDLEGYRWSSCHAYLTADPSRPGSGFRGEVAEALALLQQARPGWTYALYLQSVPEAEWDALAMELERPVVGAPAVLALVEQKRKETAAVAEAMPAVAAVTPHSAPDRLVPVPAGQPPRSFAVTMSLAMAGVALVAALLSARTVDFLRHTVKVLAEENTHTLLALSAARVPGSPIQLASFRVPQRLGGTSWEIQLKPVIASTAEAAVADRLRFDEKKVVSAQLSQTGFPAARYTAVASPAGGSWETVQIGPGGEIVSWQGEWRGHAMHGMMTRQLPGGSVETFRFIGVAQDGDTA
jgi:REP element-mobilizing transposase RayT